MPPSAGSVQLEVLAKVDQALQSLARLEARITGLGTTLSSLTSKKIEIDVSAALSAIASVTEKLQGLKTLAGAQGSIVLKADASQVVSEVNRAAAAVDSSIASIKAKAAADPFVDLARNAAIDFRKAEDELDKLDKATAATFDRLKKEAAKNVFAGIGESAAKEAKALNDEFNRLQTNFQRAVDRLSTESRRVNFDPLSQSAQRLRENVRFSADEIQSFAARTATSVRQAGGDFGRLEQAEKAAAQALRELAGTELLPKSFLSKMTEATNAVRLFLGAFVVREIINFAEGVASAISRVVSSAVELGETSAEAAIKIELIETSIKGLLGGLPEVKDATKATADQLAFLRGIADDLGINFLELATRFRSFAPAAGEAGLSLQNIDDVFRSVAVSARALGFSTDDTQRALLAFQQILQKGKFQAEELTKQLGQLLPNSLAILQRETGKSREELLKMLKAGELTSDAVLALSAGLLEAFGPTSVGNARATAAEIERFKNALLEAEKIIGDQLLPPLRELLQDLIRVGKDGQSSLKLVGQGLAGLLTPLQDAVRLLDSLFGDDRERGFVERYKAAEDTIRALFLDLDRAIRTPFLKLVELFSRVLPDAIGGPFREAIEGALDAQRQFAEGLRESADQSRGAADDFRDSWSNAGKGLAKDNEDATARLRKAYQDAAEKAEGEAKKTTKAEAAELKKRQTAFEHFFETLQKLADKPITAKLQVDDGAGGDAVATQTKKLTDFGQKIADLHKELADLLQEQKALGEQTFINPEDVNRADELRQKIGGIRQELKVLGEQKASGELTTTLDNSAKAAAKLAAEVEKAKEKVQAALDELIVRNDAFGESFKALDKTAQAAIIGLVSEFEQLNQRFGITQTDVQAFGNALLAVFQKSGAVSAEFAARLSQEFGAASAAAGGAASALRALAAAQDESTGSAQRAATAQDALAAAAKQNDFAGLRPLTNTMIQVDKATGNLVISNEKLTNGFFGTDQALKQVIGFLQEHHQSTITAKQAQDEFGLSLETIGAKFRGAGSDVVIYKDKTNELQQTLRVLGAETESAGQQLATLSNKAEEAGRILDKAGSSVQELGKKEVPPATAESVAKVGKAGEDAATGLDKAGKAAETARAPLDTVATAAEKLSKATAPAGFADGLVAIGAAAKAAAEPLSQAAAGAEKLAAGLKGIGSVSADGVGQIATAFQGLAAPLTAAAAPAGQLGDGLRSVGEAMTQIQGSVEGVSSGLTTIGEAIQAQVDSGSLATFGTQFRELDTAAKETATDLEQAATAISSIADKAPPAADAFRILVTTLNDLDLKPATSAIGDLEGKVDLLKGAAEGAADNSERLDLAMQAGKDSAEGLGRAAGTLASDLKTGLQAAFGDAESAGSDLRRELDLDTTAVHKLDQAIVDLAQRAVPLLNGVAAAASSIADSLNRAADAAERLSLAASTVKLP